MQKSRHPDRRVTKRESELWKYSIHLLNERQNIKPINKTPSDSTCFYAAAIRNMNAMMQSRQIKDIQIPHIIGEVLIKSLTSWKGFILDWIMATKFLLKILCQLKNWQTK